MQTLTLTVVTDDGLSQATLPADAARRQYEQLKSDDRVTALTLSDERGDMIVDSWARYQEDPT